ncbi:MAG: type IVB secretion system apparatus protein IcmL/DotI [Alphaproteobacteria bacterium]|nr:type IVB secretion system apparatus protein IcmL/DotI [Alphaproteobacteria bacterium]
MATTPPPSDPKAPQKAQKSASAGMAKAAASKEDVGALGRVIVRNEFYRDGYRTLLKVAFIEGIAILCLIITIVVIVNAYRPENRYFATTEDGRVVPMVALSEPNLSRPAVLSWAAQAASETLTFGFHDYRRRLQESSRHFTRKGWGSFVKALQDSGMIESVEQNRQVLTAAPRAAPTILSEGILAGIYQWQVELPMMVTYQIGQQTRNVSMNIRLTIVRVPKLESPNGIGIEQWVAYSG